MFFIGNIQTTLDFYVRVRACLRTCTSVFTFVYERVYVRVRACLRTCTCVFTYVYVRVYVRVREYEKRKYGSGKQPWVTLGYFCSRLRSCKQIFNVT